MPVPSPLPLLRRPAGRLLAVVVLLLASACTADEYVPQVLVPDSLLFTQANLYPEGVQYDSVGRRFVVSSQTTGALGQIRDDGLYNAFANEARLISTVGVRLDLAGGRNRVLTAIADPGYNVNRRTNATFNNLAALATFVPTAAQATTYQFSGYVRLDTLAAARSAQHFANDIAVDAEGNAYVTDSFAALIYKVTPGNVASVFLKDTRFAAPAGSFGLNGIVYHPDNYLLVAQTTTGTLFKIPLANPGAFTQVTLPQNLLAGADGLFLQDANTLLAATNSQGKVYRLTSSDNWASAGATGTFNTLANAYPTTLTRRGKDVYVLYSYLSALRDTTRTTPVREFEVRRVTF